MACKNCVYAANTNVQSISANGLTVNFGNIVRRFGCACNVISGTPVAKTAGYYKIETNFVVEPSDLGTTTIQLYKDGVPITGAVASETIGAISELHSIVIPAVIRNVNETDSYITAVITGAAGALNSATVSLERL